MPKREKTAPASQSLPVWSWVVLALIALAPYVSLSDKPLVADANRAIVLNQSVQSGPIAGLLAVDFWGYPTREKFASRSYRPVTSLSWAAQARVIGNGPQGFHFVDLLIHVGMTLLVALFLRQLIAVPMAVFWGAALFAVHPIVSEAVASIVGRADMLASAGALGALVLHLSAPQARQPWRHEIGALICLALAMLCKEYAVTFPFLLLLVGWSQQLIADPGKATRARRKQVWIGAFALLGGYLALRWALFGSLGGVPMIDAAGHPLVEASGIVRWANAAWIALFALGKTILPTGLNFYYHGYGTLPLAEGPFDLRALAGVAVFGGLFVGAWMLAQKRSVVPLVALALFLLPLGPALNTVSVSAVLFAERFMYLPAVGAALFVAWLVRRPLASGSVAGSAVQLALAALVLLGAFGTYQRVADYTSAETLARATLDTYPESSVAWHQVALSYGQQDKHQLAAQAFEKAIESSGDDPRLLKNYGVSLLQLGRFDDAAQAYRKAIDNSPGDLAPLWRGLGTAQLRAQRYEEAVASLSRAAQLNPEDPAVSAVLAESLLRSAQQRLAAGDSVQAGTYARQALELSGLPGEALFLAGMVLDRAGEQDGAQVAFARAVELDPDLLRRRHQQAVERQEQGDFARAEQLFEEILVAQPDHVPTLFNLGWLMVTAGRPAEAIEPLTRGLRLKDDERARALLVQARQQSRR